MTKNGYYSLKYFIFKKLQNKTREINIDIRLLATKLLITTT